MSQNGVVVFQERVPSRLSWDEWTQRVRNVAVLKKKLPFYIGDLLLLGEQMWGEKASQFLNEFGYSEGALDNFRWVSKKFPPEERCDLPWSFHQAAAKLPKRERDKALTAALAGELNRSGIRALANGTNGNGASEIRNVPTGLETLENAIAEAYVTVGKLVERRERGKLTLAALDELIEKAMALREKLAGVKS